ncbi:hypothetical protein INT44_005558 [Umbelopsis vinacea]|uniref:Uncharacterized protein n=1 Tax=Umbelopsis vinacea TaxID=44442 RepID=A0A8H7PE08_9FUNG|nr:hypothetical protein INT44_005558 [Umbelopsis vinacea]
MVTEDQTNPRTEAEDEIHKSDTESGEIENIEISSMDMEESDQMQVENDSSENETADKQKVVAHQDSNKGNTDAVSTSSKVQNLEVNNNNQERHQHAAITSATTTFHDANTNTD